MIQYPVVFFTVYIHTRKVVFPKGKLFRFTELGQDLNRVSATVIPEFSLKLIFFKCQLCLYFHLNAWLSTCCIPIQIPSKYSTGCINPCCQTFYSRANNHSYHFKNISQYYNSLHIQYVATLCCYSLYFNKCITPTQHATTQTTLNKNHQISIKARLVYENVLHCTGAPPPSACSTPFLELLNEIYSQRGISTQHDYSCFDFLHVLLI